MGKYTALDDPIVDQTIEEHMRRIVAAIRSRVEPHSIFLRGSFGRGEGSVMVQDGELRFLSDYEVNVVISSPFYRSFLAKLSRQLTLELGVDISLSWTRPDYMYKDRLGPFPMGSVPKTTGRYESRYGSLTLYGQDIFQSAPHMDPCQIALSSGVRLVLNRMAESLYYISEANDTPLDDLSIFYWINKIILACAESLLLLWGQYHYSYKERGRRFVSMADDRLDFMPDQGVLLSELVDRATEFKLRPRPDFYQGAVGEMWLKVIPVVDAVFRHLVEEVYHFSFEQYVEFPEQYLQYATRNSQSLSPLRLVIVKLLWVYKYLRKKCLPRGILLPFSVSSVVYAVVPLLFVGWTSDDETLTEMLNKVRECLELVCSLESPEPNPRNEWTALKRRMLWAWKNFCY